MMLWAKWNNVMKKLITNFEPEAKQAIEYLSAECYMQYYSPEVVFVSFHFLWNLILSPISLSVALQKTCQVHTHTLAFFGHVMKLWKN